MDLIQVLTGFLGSLGFSILFHIRGKKLIIASLGGLMSWSVFLVLAPVLPSEAMRYFFAASAVTVYAEVFARIIKTPTTTFLVPSLIPLIPGGALYYTMNYALNEQWPAFAAKAVDTLGLAFSLSLGMIAVTTLTRILIVIMKKLRGRELISLFHHSI